jgi:hypothetical protein
LFPVPVVSNLGRFAFVSPAFAAIKYNVVAKTSMKAALAHLGERQTEVHLSPALHAISGGTVFDPQKRHLFCFCFCSRGSQCGFGEVEIVWGNDYMLFFPMEEHHGVGEHDGSGEVCRELILSVVSKAFCGCVVVYRGAV